jgi:single-strand DNA-binding protein
VNVAILRGRLSSPPRLTTLPSGDELLALELTVRTDGARPDTVPVTWFGPAPTAKRWSTGAELVVVGRIRRRWFRAGGVRSSRTEVVAAAVVPAGRQAAAARAVRRALAPVDELTGTPPA